MAAKYGSQHYGSDYTMGPYIHKFLQLTNSSLGQLPFTVTAWELESPKRLRVWWVLGVEIR